MYWDNLYLVILEEDNNFNKLYYFLLLPFKLTDLLWQFNY